MRKKYCGQCIFILLVFKTLAAKAQIFTENPIEGSIIITPKGLKGSTSSGVVFNSVALGNKSLFSNISGKFNTAIGNETLYSNTYGYENTAIGHKALYMNTTGSQNTANGVEALTSNSNGIHNTAMGIHSLGNNTGGGYNIAIGNEALGRNTIGFSNSAVGFEALYWNSTGNYNTAMGYSALRGNKTGTQNSATGYSALLNNTDGGSNTANGYYSLFWNTTGSNNTASGHSAGSMIVTGYSNTFLGFWSDATDSDLFNSTAIGANAKVNASNKVRIGDASVTVIEGQVAWSNPSDRRLKNNIIYTNHLGLDFINRLRTVSYHYSADKSKTRYDGFIAQDVEQVMTDLGIPFSGLKKADDGTYSLAYSDFVMPLVNAVKELKQKNESLEERVASLEELKKQNDLLTQRLDMLEELKAEINKLKSENSSRSSESK